MSSQMLRWFACALAFLSVGSANAQSTCPLGTPQLVVYHAGSLTAALTQVEKIFTQQTGVCVVDVAAGSVDAARRITAGKEPADIFASANADDIDQFLKPAGYANFKITFAQGAMVLAYRTNSRQAGTIADPGVAFNPPGQIPPVAGDWVTQLLQPGVVIGGSNPFLDPSGYRSDLIFQLAEHKYKIDNLYDKLLGRYTMTRAGDVLGTNFDYQLTYEHSAYASYLANPSTYRYAKLPDDIGLSNPKLNSYYARSAQIVLPGLHDGRSADAVAMPASRVTWGLTILKGARNEANAVKFLQLLFSNDGVAIQRNVGPEPVVPPVTSARDHGRLPKDLRSVVSVSRDSPAD